MGYFELRQYVKKIQAEGYDVSRYLVDLQGKIAFPFVSLILVFIGMSFSLRRNEAEESCKAWALAYLSDFLTGLSMLSACLWEGREFCPLTWPPGLQTSSLPSGCFPVLSRENLIG